MKRREKLKSCKLNLHNTIVDITKLKASNGNCYKIIVIMNVIIDDYDYAKSISIQIAKALSFKEYAIVVASFYGNILTISFVEYSVAAFASLDVDSVLEGDDNILYFKNVVNVFIKD